LTALLSRQSIELVVWNSAADSVLCTHEDHAQCSTQLMINETQPQRLRDSLGCKDCCANANVLAYYCWQESKTARGNNREITRYTV